MAVKRGIGSTALKSELVAIRWPRSVWGALARIIEHHQRCDVRAFAPVDPEPYRGLNRDLDRECLRDMRAELEQAAGGMR